MKKPVEIIGVPLDLGTSRLGVELTVAAIGGSMAITNATTCGDSTSDVQSGEERG